MALWRCGWKWNSFSHELGIVFVLSSSISTSRNVSSSLQDVNVLYAVGNSSFKILIHVSKYWIVGWRNRHSARLQRFNHRPHQQPQRHGPSKSVRTRENTYIPAVTPTATALAHWIATSGAFCVCAYIHTILLVDKPNRPTRPSITLS